MYAINYRIKNKPNKWRPVIEGVKGQREPYTDEDKRRFLELLSKREQVSIYEIELLVTEFEQVQK